MPIPTPRAKEETQDFISRCIQEMHHIDPNRAHNQIIAICYAEARRMGRKVPVPSTQRLAGVLAKKR